MKHIVFPTDFSASANNALDFAKALANKYDATIHVVHAYNFTYSTGAGTEMNELLQLEALSKQKVERLVQELAAAGFKASANVLIGFLTKILPEIVQNLDDAMIVCGTTGASNVISRLLGSNAAAILEQSDVPVLVIPNDAKYEGLHKIIFATTLQTNSFAEIDYVLDIAKHFDSQLSLLKVDTDGEFHVLDDKEIAQNIKAHYPNYKLPVLHVKSDEVHNGLHHYSQKFHPNLMVMVTHHRSFIDHFLNPSQTRSFVMASPVPLLVLHHKPHQEPLSNGQNYASLQA